jgi:glycosyltransferase involved in cell wall biosynthesis
MLSPAAPSVPAASAISDYPRLLFVTSAAFNRVSGGGVTFTNLFRGWPRDRIATAHNDPIPVSTEICDRYYRLGPCEIDTWPVLRSLRRRYLRPDTEHLSSQSLILDGARRVGLPQRVKFFVFGDGLPEHGTLSPDLEDWIARFRPDLLYTPLGGIGMMEVVHKIRNRFGLPLVVHFMDDWQEAIYRGGLYSPIQRRRMRRLIADLVGSASACLGICDAMCEAYRHRFGRDFTAFQNTIDVSRWSAFARTEPGAGRKLRLLYTGSVLSFAQSESLIECCTAVAALRRQGLEIALDIYSPPGDVARFRDRLLQDEAIRLHDVIGEDEAYFRILAAADILLLPVNFDDHSMRYIHLSLPTKVPSYLVSGTPILVYGPAGMAQVDYARQAGWGLVVDRRDGEALVAAIRRLAEDLALRRSLSETARRIAAARHDSARVRTGFQTTLIEAAR